MLDVAIIGCGVVGAAAAYELSHYPLHTAIFEKIPPIGLSGGVKTLILVKFEPEKVFNISTCGDNCAKWLLKIAEREDRTVNLRHLMDFGKKPFTVKVLNTNQIVHSMEELIWVAGEFV